MSKVDEMFERLEYDEKHYYKEIVKSVIVFNLIHSTKHFVNSMKMIVQMY